MLCGHVVLAIDCIVGDASVLRYEEIPIPKPASNQVLVKVAAIGLLCTAWGSFTSKCSTRFLELFGVKCFPRREFLRHVHP